MSRINLYEYLHSPELKKAMYYTDILAIIVSVGCIVYEIYPTLENPNYVPSADVLLFMILSVFFSLFLLKLYKL